MSGNAFVRLDGVVRRYGEVAALDGIDLQLRAAEVVVVVGPNGAGKTTLLDVVAGTLEPTAGTVEVDGVDAATPAGRRHRRATVAHVGDLPVLYPELSVEEHLDLVAVAHGVVDPDARIEELLAAFALGPRRGFLPHELSAGMRQKLHLAATFLRDAQLYVLDEPARALDRDARHALWDRVAAVRDAGAAVLVVTHDQSLPGAIVDRGIVVTGGRVVEDGPGSVALAHLHGTAEG